jgi:pimeloyl-ACP methyl ester carboxylesterase
VERVSRLAVNGGELEYVDEGWRVPVVFSHGGASDIRYWEPQRAAFTAEHRFVAYSRRFHGGGAWLPEADASPEAHAEDLTAIMSQLAAGPVHVVGFSTAVALSAAAREPALFRSLTIVEPNVPSLLTDDAVDRNVLRTWRSATERLRELYGADPARHAATWFELVNNFWPWPGQAPPATGGRSTCSRPGSGPRPS